MGLIESEDRYLLLLRRFTIGTAALLLVFAVLLGVYSAVDFARATYLTNSSIRLPSDAELRAIVNPCPYLVNTDPESNGTGPEGTIAVLGVLSACDLEVLPLVFPTRDAAETAAANSIMSITIAHDFTYDDEAAALESLKNYASTAVMRALRPLASAHEDYDIFSEEEVLELELRVANNLSYYASAVASVSQPTASYAIPYAEDIRAREHLSNAFDFFANQVYVSFNESRQNYVTAQTDGGLLFIEATALISFATGFFLVFLLLMFIFVFIKMEVDLREIRDQLSRT